MNKGWLWFMAGAVLVFLLVFGLGFFLPVRGFWSASQWMSPHMYGGWGGFSPLWMMFGMWFIPLIVILLIGLGVAALVKLFSSSSPRQTDTGKPCPTCGKTLSPDWKHCPHCGTAVS